MIDRYWLLEQRHGPVDIANDANTLANGVTLTIGGLLILLGRDAECGDDDVFALPYTNHHSIVIISTIGRLLAGTPVRSEFH